MPNVPVPDHPLIGTEQVFLPAGAVADPAANTPTDDSRLIARHGDKVIVEQVFENWNEVPGLTMAYVRVPSTGHHTHFSPAEMGLAGDGATAARPQPKASLAPSRAPVPERAPGPARARPGRRRQGRAAGAARQASRRAPG
jgi:hypothetical protein